MLWLPNCIKLRQTALALASLVSYLAAGVVAPDSVSEFTWLARVCTGKVGGSFLILSPRFSWIGVNLRRNCLLRSLILLLPSILTLYCLFGTTSTTTPLLNHLRALLTACFCTMTLSSSSRGACSLTWVDRFSWALADLLGRPSSLPLATSCHVLDKVLVMPSSGKQRVEDLEGKKYFIVQFPVRGHVVPQKPLAWGRSPL